jgi:hypothetical protein
VVPPEYEAGMLTTPLQIPIDKAYGNYNSRISCADNQVRLEVKYEISSRDHKRNWSLLTQIIHIHFPQFQAETSKLTNKLRGFSFKPYILSDYRG